MVPLQEMISNSLQSVSLLFICLFSIFILYLSIKRRNHTKSLDKLIPSPPKLPFIGNMYQMSSLYHQSLYSLSLKYGPLMLVHFGEVPWLIVSSSDMARSVMWTHDPTFATRPSTVVSDIVLISDIAYGPYGEDWRQLKKIFTTHLLSAKKVASYNTIRLNEVTNLIAKISSHVSLQASDPINLSKLLFSLMIDTVCSIVSGKFRLDERRYALTREVVEEIFYLLGQFSIGDLFPSLTWLEGLIGLSKRAARNRKNWNLLLEEVIQAHVHSKAENGEQDNFVDILLSLKKDSSINFVPSMDQMKGVLIDAIAGAIDTIYITTDWAMSELIKNPEPMNKLQEEVRGIAKRNDMVRPDDLTKMSYIKAVIKETLRLHPPAPLLPPREAMEECKINGFTIPKGTKVTVNAWAIGREAKSWEVPEEFMPERFIESKLDYKGNDFNFIPFGAGRRICPGILFASSMSELVLANLVHHFDWELPRGMTREKFDMGEAPGLTVHRKDELRLIAKKVQT